jgi:hypothetical protein
MKTDLSAADLLALVEIVDKHVGRNFSRIDPPHFLRDIQKKLDSIIVRHRREVEAAAKRPKKRRTERKLKPAPVDPRPRRRI